MGTRLTPTHSSASRRPVAPLEISTCSIRTSSLSRFIKGPILILLGCRFRVKDMAMVGQWATAVAETMDMEGAATDTVIKATAAAKALEVIQHTVAITDKAVTQAMAPAIRDMANSHMADSRAVTTTRATVEGIREITRRRTVVRTEGTRTRSTAAKAPDILHDSSKNWLV